MSVIDYVDELVYFDGNSTDGTIEIVRHIQDKYDKQGKIKLFENKDCADLKEDYVRINNECLRACTGDYVWFLHPDMIIENPEVIRQEIDGKFIRYSIETTSIAGEDGGKIIAQGRLDRWSTIYKNDFGLHYHGFYGSPDEDFYFRDITGDEHKCYDFLTYRPYPIKRTSIHAFHYCETKDYQRRLDKMRKVLGICFPNVDESSREQGALIHPRVTLKDGAWRGVPFVFVDNLLKKPDAWRYAKEMEEVCRKRKS